MKGLGDTTDLILIQIYYIRIFIIYNVSIEKTY